MASKSDGGKKRASAKVERSSSTRSSTAGDKGLTISVTATMVDSSKWEPVPPYSSGDKGARSRYMCSSTGLGLKQ